MSSEDEEKEGVSKDGLERDPTPRSQIGDRLRAASECIVRDSVSIGQDKAIGVSEAAERLNLSDKDQGVLNNFFELTLDSKENPTIIDSKYVAFWSTLFSVFGYEGVVSSSPTGEVPNIEISPWSWIPDEIRGDGVRQIREGDWHGLIDLVHKHRTGAYSGTDNEGLDLARDHALILADWQ